MRLLFPSIPRLRLTILVAVLLSVMGAEVKGQSTDARFPTPVSANEIADSIAARDIGDSRLTDYFYTFTGLPGDLLVTVESKNLNGDIDIFTAGELRPLLKITFYAESTSSSSKNIYLRKRQSLILRIEARTPNDDPGTYQIRFSGSFEPTKGAELEAESEKTPETSKDVAKSGDRRTSRVSSVGARIEEPAAEVAAAPAPTPKPTPKEKAESDSATPVVKEPARSTPRTAGTRRPPPRKPAPRKPAPTKTDSSKTGTDEPVESATSKTVESPTEATDNSAAAAKKSENKPEPYRRPSTRRAPPRTPARTPTAPVESKARLVIEQKDGSRREFLMSNVRKVTVENGEIVVENNDGVTQRISMTQVARMSIGP